MSNVGENEARRQKRVADFFLSTLGYRYLGFRKNRDGNSNVEEDLLSNWLNRHGHSDRIIAMVLHEVGQARALGGKSPTMVWLAKWIREHVTDSRVLLITDRTELDEQIEKVFSGVSEDIYRTRSGADLVRVLNASEEWLICSLIHKFGAGEELSDKDIDAYGEDIKQNLRSRDGALP